MFYVEELKVVQSLGVAMAVVPYSKRLSSPDDFFNIKCKKLYHVSVDLTPPVKNLFIQQLWLWHGIAPSQQKQDAHE